MPAYADINGDSGVSSYNIGDDYIDVTFKKGGTYRYTHASAGKVAVEQMKMLAKSGDGLNSYINRNKPPYA